MALEEREDGSLERITWQPANGRRPACLTVKDGALNTTLTLAEPNDFWVQFRTAVHWLAEMQGVPVPEDIDKYGHALLRRYGLWARPVIYYIAEETKDGNQ